MIVLDRVHYRYPDAGPALSDISLRIEAGERVVLLGANGCGKSTLLKLLNGLLSPGSGSIHYQDACLDARRLADKAWCRRFRREVTLLFQQPDAMLFNPTVLEEIAYGRRDLPETARQALAREWALRVGLDEAQLESPPFRLSGGQKQRLCLAAVLILEPKLLLMDEPTANLDPRGTGWLIDFLLDLSAVTTVISTHNLALARELGERAIILGDDGRIAYDGPLEPALADTELLYRANLAHRHRHRRGGHSHIHSHADLS